MSDTNLRLNSSIELSDIRKLDSLLTQCETSSCEKICIDCCAKLGSLEDEDDEHKHCSSHETSGSGSEIIPTPTESTSKMKSEKPSISRQLAVAGDTKSSLLSYKHDVPTIISSHVSSPNRSQLSSPTNSIYHLGHHRQLGADAQHQQFNQFFAQQSTDLKTVLYCSRCGGFKENETMSALQTNNFCSFDKGHNEMSTPSKSLLEGGGEMAKGASENALQTQKQYSLESNNKSSASVKQLSLTNACEKCDIGKTTKTVLVRDASIKSRNNNGQRGDNASSSNRSIRDKSNSSQNSLRESYSRKNSVFHLGDRDSTRSKRKVSSRGQNFNADDFDAETREILLGGTQSHSSKFEAFETIKIPEPVEAVGLSIHFSLCFAVRCSVLVA